jgi:large subunit ribosomal protein L10
MAKIKQATKKTGRERKEVIVAELVQKLDNSNGLVFTDYKGLTHKQLEDLKRELKKLDSTMVIAKNTLLKLAIEQSKFKENGKDLEPAFNDPTATLLISGDMVEPLKKLQKTIKELGGLPHIKVGVLEGSVADEKGVLQIASLPSRETLIAQFVGMLNSPIQGFVSGLNAIPTKFVMTLDAVAKARPSSPAVENNGGQAKPADNTSVPVAKAPASTETENTQEPNDQTAQEPEQAVAASEPAETPDEPLITDESPDPTQDTDSPDALNTNSETNDEKTDE